MSIRLEMIYFYPLHFVMGVCKQLQMPSQFAKVFENALILIFKTKTLAL
jgi:hypothetical protein